MTRSVLPGLALAAICAAITWLCGWRSPGIAILAGAILAAANYGVLAFLVTRIVTPGTRRPKLLYLLAFAAKFLVIGLLLYLCIGILNLHGLGIIIGITTVLISVITTGLINARSAPGRED